MKYIIPMNGLIGWECANCKASVSSMIKNDTAYPVSECWSIKRQEVYCSSSCSLRMGRELKRV